MYGNQIQHPQEPIKHTNQHQRVPHQTNKAIYGLHITILLRQTKANFECGKAESPAVSQSIIHQLNWFLSDLRLLTQARFHELRVVSLSRHLADPFAKPFWKDF